VNEFDLIDRVFASRTKDSRVSKPALLGIGDDCALIPAPAKGKAWAISTDTFTEGIHYFSGTKPHAIGHKALAVNLSDCAAMGATPRYVTLAVSLPKDQTQRAMTAFLRGFAKGFFALAEQHSVQLIGGDTTSINVLDSKRLSARAPFSCTITVFGEVSAAEALRRSGARVGDDIWLSGPVGLAATATAHRYGSLQLAAKPLAIASRALDYPNPQIALGELLVGIASSAIDVSDGLAQDLGHILKQSKVGATLDGSFIDACATTLKLSLEHAQPFSLHGGDDYQLCFTASPKHRKRIENLPAASAPLRIGVITSSKGLTLVRNGVGKAINLKGFSHV
jgi:thiamine-monophosphate kinase